MSMHFLGCLALACVATAQTPAFEVATLKISEPITPELVQSGRLQMGVSIDSKYVRISKLSLLELVSLAYQLKSYQLTAPSWMANQRYDIQAKLPEGGARGQVPAMLQTLLAERLALKSHREPQERKVYALTVAKGGHRLKEAAPDNAPKEPPASTGQIRGGLAVAPGGAVSTLDPGGNSRMTPGPNGNMHIESKSITMPRLVGVLQRYCDLPLLDMTGLAGAYELAVDVSGEEIREIARAHGAVIRAPASEPSDPPGVSLRSSLERLGLRLETRKLQVDVLVVDSAEKIPIEN